MVTEYVVRLCRTFMNGGQLPLDLNDGLFILLSEAERDDDNTPSAEGIFRRPADPRPLTLKAWKTM